jgi:hypothetical protein
MAAGYVVQATADIALSAATPKTCINVIAAANGMISVTGLSASFDGVSATAEPCTVELCYSTQATAGTPGSSPTPVQVRGAARTVQSGGAINYSAEPTVLTVFHTWLVHPQSGITIQYPFGREPQQVVTADGMLLRVTAPATVNMRGWIEFEEG